LFYPIINELDRVNVVGIKDYDPTQHEVVGLLAAPFYWRAMIRASDSKGIVVVFDSPCNEAFSYQVDGTRVKYLGVGDQHDNKYDGLFMEKVLTGKRSDLDTVASYSGAPLNTELCPVTVKLYPSDEMKDDFTTSGPLIFTLGAVGIFLFTSLVFVLYDYYVERRQKLVLSTATRSSAIVSSLFPSQVRDQLYPTTGSTTKETNSGSIQKFLSASKGTDNEDLTSYKQLSGTPIAELYTDTTVFFADIAGFTSWSAQRSPTQVFHLLETLYGAFDEIADRHGVFKVETIGDSYVAVVGLPVPRKHHAVVMARFAQECMDVTSDVTRDLERSLGEVRTTVLRLADRLDLLLFLYRRFPNLC
jgi:Adenylate and Guanylate cyclase catalytic domain